MLEALEILEKWNGTPVLPSSLCASCGILSPCLLAFHWGPTSHTGYSHCKLPQQHLERSCSRQMIWCMLEPQTATLVQQFLWIFLRIEEVIQVVLLLCIVKYLIDYLPSTCNCGLLAMHQYDVE